MQAKIGIGPAPAYGRPADAVVNVTAMAHLRRTRRAGGHSLIPEIPC